MLTIFSLDHREWSPADRERLGPSSAAALGLAVGIHATGGQAAFLATCNRAELIAWLPDVAAGEARWIVGRLAGAESALSAGFLSQARVYEGSEAVRHLARVAAGLESQVTGDIQVLGQVRSAYQDAALAGTVGAELHRVLQLALRAGKRVHTETGFGRRAASVGSVAAGWLRERGARRVVLIGAGKTVEHGARALAASGAELIVVNRSLERGTVLALTLGASALPFDERHQALALADGAIVATGAREAVVEASGLAGFRRHASGSLAIADLGMPRNVESAVGELPGVTVAGLDRFVDNGGHTAERREAEGIVAREADEFEDWLLSRRRRLSGVA